MLTTHLAPGIGVFMPALWSIPENPIRRAFGLSNIVSGISTWAPNPIVLEILAKQKLTEAIQENPLGPVGLGCGPPARACEVGLCGLDGAVDDVLKSVTSSMGDWKTWAVVGVGIVGLVLFTGGGGAQRRSEIAAARAQYKAQVATIRAARPRRYQKFV